MEPDERYELIAGMNRTELMQTLKELGYSVHPGCPEELLHIFLVDRADPEGYDVPSNPINSWRQGLINFIDEHWVKLRPQLFCPAKDLKTTNPRPCFGCTDIQVLTCVVQAGEKYPNNIVMISNLRHRHQDG